MARNKVVFGSDVLIDLTSDNVTPESLVSGTTAHDKSGVVINGTNPYEKVATDNTVQEQADLISQIKTALQGKVGGSGGGTQMVTVSIVVGSTVKSTQECEVGSITKIDFSSVQGSIISCYVSIEGIDMNFLNSFLVNHSHDNFYHYASSNQLTDSDIYMLIPNANTTIVITLD